MAEVRWTEQAVIDLDQLGGNPDPVALPTDAALQDGVHAELARHLADVDVLVLVGEG